MPKKLTARQVAARRNRAKWKGHTPEGLERLRQAALEHKPWEHSTGPRTAAGKAVSCQNALVHGEHAVQCLPAPVTAVLDALKQARAGGSLPSPAEVTVVVAYFFDRPGLGGVLRGASVHLQYTQLCRQRASLEPFDL